MEPIKFKDCNKVFAEDQPEYGSLPALQIESKEGEVITCWSLGFMERFKVLFNGRIWLSSMTFNKPLTPVAMSTNSKDLYYDTADDNKRWWGKLFKIFKKHGTEKRK